MNGVMRFGKKGKLSPRYKCMGDPTSIVPLESVVVKDCLTYEDVPVEILDRQVRRWRNKEVTSVKISRSCRCNPRFPPADHRVTHGPSWWFVDGQLRPSPETQTKTILAHDPRLDPLTVGQTMDRGSTPQILVSKLNRWTDRMDRGSSIDLRSVHRSRPSGPLRTWSLKSIDGLTGWIMDQSTNHRSICWSRPPKIIL
ncbi:hypothetical protein MTR67_051296 [Solanum verrucosum]|uniref:Uncharacterized protein n=1 Tax=Solanum verrucosum TaxID=315347 RepID=A0AAF0V746_SOLVR|nr:hypothetical protein MTR67_051296 [Solanum verrucosum]